MASDISQVYGMVWCGCVDGVFPDSWIVYPFPSHLSRLLYIVIWMSCCQMQPPMFFSCNM